MRPAVIVTSNFSPWSPYAGGGQWSAHRLASALARHGRAVTCIYTRAPGEHVCTPEVPYAIRWATLPARRSTRAAPLRPLSGASVSRVAASVIRESGPAVLHAQGEEGCLLPHLARRTGSVLIVTPRYPSYPAGLRRKSAGRIRRAAALLRDPKFLALRWAVRGADACCPTSRASACQVALAFGVPACRLHPIPNGVAPALAGVDRSGPRPDGPLVFWGRLERTKGVDTLLEAIAMLGGRKRVLLIGTGDEPRVRATVRAHRLDDRVTLLGWRSPERIADVLRDASVAVLPSREESFGNSVVEAMVAGVPLVTTRAGSIPELVPACARTRLVRPGDAAGTAAAIASILSDPDRAHRAARATRAYARQRFDWTETARQFEQLYDATCARVSSRCTGLH